MTRKEWLSCEDPEAMLGHLGAKFSDRRRRLFACACCRRLWHFVRDERLAGVIDAIERYANGDAKERARIDARKTAASLRDNVNKPQDCLCDELGSAAEKTIRRGQWHPGELAAAAVGWSTHSNFTGRKSEERAAQAAILREMVGNPFRPVTFDPKWRTSDVMLLAQGIYEDRAFDRMPILADALQDAGCDNEDILAHCRDASATHVRGCWVVDLVLGKE